jgi:spore germination cell wall hydrolase CwlJ-like protein
MYSHLRKEIKLKLLINIAIATLALLPLSTGIQDQKSYQWYTKQELACHLKNVYFEARGESFMGQIAVAKVVLNRQKSNAAKNYALSQNTVLSICDVVYQPKQFSWTNKKHIPKAIPTTEMYDAVHLAQKYNFDATHYHNLTVSPPWAKKMTLIATIGNHKFYK